MSANDRQVGGEHYKAAIQHWDWAWSAELDFFQYQITKYVSRWKKKGKVQDLEKAQHFLEKYLEVVRERSDHPLLKPMYKQPLIEELPRPPLTPYDLEVQGRVKQWSGFTFEGSKDGKDEYTCTSCRAKVWVPYDYDPFQEHGGCPGRNYVQQE